jgi:hypothetical protein
MNFAVSSLSSHLGQTGSTRSSLKPQIWHCPGVGSAVNVSKSSFMRGGSSGDSDMPRHYSRIGPQTGQYRSPFVPYRTVRLFGKKVRQPPGEGHFGTASL